MATPDSEIAVGDPDAPADSSPAVSTTRTVEIVVYVVLLGLALLLGYDNWRSGAGWAKDGPQSGYLPFYLCVILAGASIFGLFTAFRARGPSSTFVTRDQLRRVLQVFVPTFVFVVLMQWLGLYVASFLLITGFMIAVGRIAAWKSVLTAAIFSIAMFVTFEIAFDVIMPKGPLEHLLGY